MLGTSPCPPHAPQLLTGPPRPRALCHTAPVPRVSRERSVVPSAVVTLDQRYYSVNVLNLFYFNPYFWLQQTCDKGYQPKYKRVPKVGKPWVQEGSWGKHTHYDLDYSVSSWEWVSISSPIPSSLKITHQVVWGCGSWGLRDSPSPDHTNCSGITRYQETLDKLKVWSNQVQ